MRSFGPDDLIGITSSKWLNKPEPENKPSRNRARKNPLRPNGDASGPVHGKSGLRDLRRLMSADLGQARGPSALTKGAAVRRKLPPSAEFVSRRSFCSRSGNETLTL